MYTVLKSTFLGAMLRKNRGCYGISIEVVTVSMRLLPFISAEL